MCAPTAAYALLIINYCIFTEKENLYQFWCWSFSLYSFSYWALRGFAGDKPLDFIMSILSAFAVAWHFQPSLVSLSLSCRKQQKTCAEETEQRHGGSCNSLTFVNESVWLMMILKFLFTKCCLIGPLLTVATCWFFQSLLLTLLTICLLTEPNTNRWISCVCMKVLVFWTRRLNLKDTFITCAWFTKAGILLTSSRGSSNWSKW